MSFLSFIQACSKQSVGVLFGQSGNSLGSEHFQRRDERAAGIGRSNDVLDHRSFGSRIGARFGFGILFRQLGALSAYCAELGVELMGDAPIYVAWDGADVWAARGLFDLEPDGRPRCVAGVPPDYFSETGQRWGNPLYRWEEMRRDGFASMKGSGELQTPLLKFNGEYFFVNANVTGGLQVELLDAQGAVISGFSKDDCTTVKGDGTKLRVEWKNNPTLASLEGENIKIKFYLDNGEIYAFWISPEETGESHGYTGGGGPGLDPSGMDINN